MFEQVKLNYDFASLEPHIDGLTMQTHYGKHHAGYTNNLNNALEKLPQLAGKSIEEILSNLATIEDAALRTAVRNNGGGYYNHNLYFDILSPAGGQPPQGKLAEQIKADFNSFDELVQKLTSTAASVFGSGWAWLSKDPRQTGCNQYAQPGQSPHDTWRPANPHFGHRCLGARLLPQVQEHARRLSQGNIQRH